MFEKANPEKLILSKCENRRGLDWNFFHGCSFLSVQSTRK